MHVTKHYYCVLFLSITKTLVPAESKEIFSFVNAANANFHNKLSYWGQER